MTASAAELPDPTRCVHRALLVGMLARGVVPSGEELARAAGAPADDLPVHLAALAQGDYLALDAAGRVACLYPFSTVATPHVVAIGAGRRFAMCSIDALGVAAMIGHPVAIEGVCVVCGAPIRVEVAPGAIMESDPPETVVVARRSGAEPACETCCPHTLFACGPAHGEEAAGRSPETTAVPLAEALLHAESIFGGFLGERLPAQRPRSQLTTLNLRT